MFPFNIKMTTAVILFVYFYTVSAFWRLPCPHQIGLARVDPLLAPGAISAHAHTIHGGNSKPTYTCSVLSTRPYWVCLGVVLTLASLRLRRECHPGRPTRIQMHQLRY